jgi:hypothetical protein
MMPCITSPVDRERWFFARLASARKAPPFTLSEFVAGNFGDALRADNVKSGTRVVDAAPRFSRAVLESLPRVGYPEQQQN